MRLWILRFCIGLISLNAHAVNDFDSVLISNWAKIGGTASAVSSAALEINSTTKGLLISRMTETQRDAISSPATGLMIYNTTSSFYNYYNGSSWKSIVSSTLTTKGDLLTRDSTDQYRLGVGTNGSILMADSTSTPGLKWHLLKRPNNQTEYVSNGKAEIDTTGWSMYADAAGVSPVDGTSGSPATVLSRTTTGSEVIRESASFKMAKSAASRQGEGASYDIVLDSPDYQNSSVVYVSFDYKTTSNYASGDIQVFVYDKDVGTTVPLFDSNSLSGAINSSTSGTQFTGFFYPTTTTSDDYRLIFHITSTNANAYDFIFDSVHVGSATSTSPSAIPPLVTTYTSGSGTHNLTGAPLYIRVRMVGGGGGGAGSGTTGQTSGGDGGNTTFGTSLLVANGGTRAIAGASGGGAGGTASLGTGPIGTAVTGQYGQAAVTESISTTQALGGNGGGSALFGGGGAGQVGGGTSGVANTGGGGAGGSTGGAANTRTGAGGGGAGAVDAIIKTPASSYAYSVGAAGTAGAAGTSGYIGGAGSVGYIEVTEYYGASISTAEALIQNPAKAPTTTTSSTKTPSASGHFHALTGNSLTLGPGTWRISGNILFNHGGTTSSYTSGGGGFYAANGGDSSSTPALLTTLSGLTLLTPSLTTVGTALEVYANLDSARTALAVSPVTIKLTQTQTIYLVSYAGMSTPANSRITVYANAERLADFAVSSVVGGMPTRTVFTASGTWTNQNCKYIDLIVTGGGAAGGGTAANNRAAGGGGAGATAIKRLVAGSFTDSVTVTIGAGSTGGTGNSSAGSQSSFGSYVSADGGGGASGNFTQNSGGLGSSTTTGADISIGGGGGGSGSSTAANNEFSGVGGASYWGGGGRGITSNGGGSDGLAYGSGGGGAVSDGTHTNNAGGGGKSGIVVVDCQR